MTVVYFFFPETSGRSLEEVDEIFLQSKSIFDTVKVSLRLPRQNLAKFGVAAKIIELKENTGDHTIADSQAIDAVRAQTEANYNPEKVGGLEIENDTGGSV
jgi:hypothetical protein